MADREQDVEVDLDVAPDDALPAAAGARAGLGGGTGQGGGAGPGRGARGLLEWPERSPAWVRGPAVVLVAAATAAALTWAVGVRHVRAEVARDAAATAAVLSLQVGSPHVGGWDTRPVGLGGGEEGLRSVIRVLLPLSNRGTEPVRVSVLGISSLEDRVLQASDPLVVDAGDTTTALLLLDGGCTGVPGPADVLPAEEPERARVSMEVAGQVRELEVPYSSDGYGSAADQLAWLCRPWGGGSAVHAAAAVLDDGRARFTVTNAGDGPATVDVQDSLSLGLSSDPPLPLDLPAGQQVRITLSLSPDCARIADGLSQQVDLVALPRGMPTGDAGPGTEVLSDQLATAPWVARQVALACG